MKVTQDLCILLWLRKSKADEKGQSPIYVRLTIEGARVEFSLGRKIHPDKWLPKAGIAKGTSEEARTLNNYINIVKGNIQKHYNVLMTQHKEITPEMVRNAYLGIDEQLMKEEHEKTLLDTFDYHNLKFKEKVEAEFFSENTLSKYETTRLKVVEFLKHEYNSSDISLLKLRYSFLTNFEHFLLTTQRLQTNTVTKYIKNLMKVVRLAVSEGWLKENPFVAFKCSHQETHRMVLTQQELDTLQAKIIKIPRLAEIRDVFLFSCYTGFAYNELEALEYDAVQVDMEGEKWLSINRGKTGTLESVMLLPIPLQIIETYRDHPYCKVHQKLLPVKSNQKYNAYLKELADICGISKNLTTHLARHTFATTVTLLNDVPIETISALLGHKNIKTTQIYAKVVKTKISNNMKALREKLYPDSETPVIELDTKAS